MGLEIRKLSTLSYPTFLWKMALVDTNNVLISTYQFSKLSNQSHSVSHYRCSHSLFPIVWLHCSSRFTKATGDALGLVEKQLVLRFQISKGNRRNPLMLPWWNSCTNCLPVPSRATPITIGKRGGKTNVTVPDPVKPESRCRLSRAHNWPGVPGIWDGEEWGRGRSVHEQPGAKVDEIAPRKRRDSK
jgi:hypothetical protein